MSLNLNDKEKHLLLSAVGDPTFRDRLANSINKAESAKDKVDLLISLYLQLLDKLDNDSGIADNDFVSTLGNIE